MCVVGDIRTTTGVLSLKAMYSKDLYQDNFFFNNPRTVYTLKLRDGIKLTQRKIVIICQRKIKQLTKLTF